MPKSKRRSAKPKLGPPVNGGTPPKAVKNSQFNPEPAPGTLRVNQGCAEDPPADDAA